MSLLLFIYYFFIFYIFLLTYVFYIHVSNVTCAWPDMFAYMNEVLSFSVLENPVSKHCRL